MIEISDADQAVIMTAAGPAIERLITPGMVERALELAAADAGIPVEEAFARAIRWARGAA